MNDSKVGAVVVTCRVLYCLGAQLNAIHKVSVACWPHLARDQSAYVYIAPDSGSPEGIPGWTSQPHDDR